MLEMLICMCVICAFMLLTVYNTDRLDLQHYYFLNDYLYNQSLSMLNKEDISIGYGVNFNSMGHVNQARTIEFANHEIVIHLGNGYVTQK